MARYHVCCIGSKQSMEGVNGDIPWNSTSYHTAYVNIETEYLSEEDVNNIQNTLMKDNELDTCMLMYATRVMDKE